MEVVKVENLSKKYKLYQDPMDRLKESINVFGKKFHREFFALSDVDFKVNKGEIFGIIGENGSGKSTLLKIISGVLTPTKGNVSVKGKVSALLELGAGFNLELTGIENIYLNGTIRGFSKREIDELIHDILSFADIGDFVYQPVKMYSSGMFVRLAFAVQACIEPEILIVDEALAVGDAAFSFKCINHMKNLVNKGVTILFVTHDVQAVRSFCDKAIWLNQGKVKLNGDPYYVTTEYVRYLFNKEKKDEYTSTNIKSNGLSEKNKNEDSFRRWGNGDIKVKNITLLDENGKEINMIEWGNRVAVKFIAKAVTKITSQNIGFGFSFRNKNGLDVIVSTTIEEGLKFGPFQKDDEITVEFELENILAPGDYLLTLQIEDRTNSKPEYYEFIENAKIFKVIARKNFYSTVQPRIVQKIRVNGRAD